MKTFNLRRDALGICAAVALLSGCGGSQAPSMSLAPQIAAPQSAAAGSALHVGPLFFFRFRIKPHNPTIQVNQQRELRASLTDGIGWCKVDATWSTSGGSLQVIDGGKEAIFSASLPGKYTVGAKYNSFSDTDKVRVTSPQSPSMLLAPQIAAPQSANPSAPLQAEARHLGICGGRL